MPDFNDFLINASTYKPFKLDFTYERILQVFVENESTSVYQVFKRLTDTSPGLIQSGLDYKNVHVRIKRLVELKQIEQMKKHFERGAIHYKITTYGLISYLSQSTYPVNFNSFKIHKNNSLIKNFVYQFLEEETIDSLEYFDHRPIVPADLISDYIRDCCRAVFDICSQSYYAIDENLDDILPSDKTIQDYMAYLVRGEPIANKQSILKEFKEYEMKFEAKVDDPELMYLLLASDNYSKRYSENVWFRSPFNRDLKIDNSVIKAPFPILDIFNDMGELNQILSIKINALALQVTLSVGELCNLDYYKDKKTRKLNIDFHPNDIVQMNTGGRDEQIVAILQDKKFKSVVDSIQGEYKIGLEAFKRGKPIGMEKPT